MKVRRYLGHWAGVLGILAGVWSCVCAPPPDSKPPSDIANLLSRLPDTGYRASLVYARASGASHPLAVILDPRGGEKLSVLELSAMEFFTEDLGELGRKDLIARLDGIEGRRFGGRTLRYLERFSKWRLRTIMRFGAPIGYLITVDPRLRFEIRGGTSGRVFSVFLLPASNFVDKIRGEE